MSTQEIFFYVFSVLAVAFSLLVVLNKNPINSAFSLVMVFFCVAANFVILQAHLIATLQILVYAGAIMVLFIFVIMLLNADIKSVSVSRNPVFRVLSAVFCGALFFMIVKGIRTGTISANHGQFTAEKIEQLGGNTRVLSTVLFSDYILPFELTSILLLVGIAGSVALAKRKLEAGREVKK